MSGDLVNFGLLCVNAAKLPNPIEIVCGYPECEIIQQITYKPGYRSCNQRVTHVLTCVFGTTAATLLLVGARAEALCVGAV